MVVQKVPVAGGSGACKSALPVGRINPNSDVR